MSHLGRIEREQAALTALVVLNWSGEELPFQMQSAGMSFFNSHRQACTCFDSVGARSGTILPELSSRVLWLHSLGAAAELQPSPLSTPVMIWHELACKGHGSVISLSADSTRVFTSSLPCAKLQSMSRQQPLMKAAQTLVWDRSGTARSSSGECANLQCPPFLHLPLAWNMHIVVLWKMLVLWRERGG